MNHQIKIPMAENEIEFNIAHCDMGTSNIDFSFSKEGITANVWINPDDLFEILENEICTNMIRLTREQQLRLVGIATIISTEIAHIWEKKECCDKCEKDIKECDNCKYGNLND